LAGCCFAEGKVRKKKDCLSKANGLA